MLKEPKPLSLFEMARQVSGAESSIIMCTKATLVHISHQLEDIVLTQHIPALMFTGFQESSHWKEETERYQKLAAVAQQVCIFAGKPLPDEVAASAIQIELEGEDPLRQEWFVAIISPVFSVVLAGLDNLKPVEDEGLREFETLLTFSPALIGAILDRLENILEFYRPDVRDTLRQARRDFGMPDSNAYIMGKLINGLVEFEEKLNLELSDANALTRGMLEKLLRERDLNRMLIEASPALYVTLAQDGKIIMSNPAMTDVFSSTVLEGRDVWSIAPPADEALYREALQQLQQGDLPAFRAQVMTRAGGERTIEWVGRIIERSDDEPTTFFLMGNDITAQLEAEELRLEEERLRLALQFERESNEALTRFMSITAHELRTPLSTILTSAEMLERHIDTMTTDVRNRRIERIKEQVNQLNAMMNDMSTVLQANEGMFTFTSNPTDVVRFCRNLIDSVHLAYPSEHTLSFNHSWPYETVSTDTRLLTHILSNLIVNAIKYTPTSTTISLSLYEAAGNMVYEIIDQGRGILPEDKDSIFEPFYRGTNAAETSGTGLGLKIVYDCVQIYGGAIDFTSTPTGTTFIVRLPLQN